MRNRILLDDFCVVMKILKTAYPSNNFLPDEYATNLWYKALQDIPYPTLNRAATNYIMTNRFPPTIADIRELAYKCDPTSNGMTIPSAAWNQFIRALRRSYAPDSEQVWEQLPETTKLVVGGYSTFRQWGNMSIESLESVQRPMFIKRFEEYQRREMQNNSLPEAVRMKLPTLPAEPKRVQIEDKRTGDGVEAPADRLQELRKRLGNG